jgi:signal transduction histidine kinase
MNGSIILLSQQGKQVNLTFMELSTRRMEQLLQIGRELSAAADLELLLDKIVTSAAEMTGSQVSSILLYDDEAVALRFIASFGAGEQSLQAIPVPLEKSIAGAAFLEKRLVAVRDAAKSARHFKRVDQVTRITTRSILAAPIIYREQALGVIEILNKIDSTDYNGEDATILETLASLLALALENASLESIIEKIKEETQRLDKMKTDFIAITSHELRTPLGLILGHSTFLREILEDEYHDQLDTIIRNAMRLKEIIENMTSVDNAQTGTAVLRSRTVSVRKIIEETTEKCHPEARLKKLHVRTALGQSELLIEGDSEKIGIIINNLLKNAITFTNEGGHITIAAEQVPGYIKIAVSDDGIGIPAKDIAHIFERFYQVESHLTRKHGGMGLGLSVTKMMVEMHGGRIGVESVPGKGSNFTILLPLDSAQAEATGKVFIT